MTRGEGEEGEGRQEETGEGGRGSEWEHGGGLEEKGRVEGNSERFRVQQTVRMEQVFIDEETGESLVHPFLEYDAWRYGNSVNNAETGEPEVNVEPGNGRTRRIPFQIPKEVKQRGLSRKERLLKKQENLMGLEPMPWVNPICLFLPAVVYFRWFLVLFMLLEIALHVWAHHKNKMLRNSSIYFRSPFHVISSEFCALCQNETCMNRIGKIQQMRMHKFLRHCNYMKRVVT